MASAVSNAPDMTAAGTPDPAGRIPFRVRIGVTGHRRLDGGHGLAEEVRSQVRRVRELFPDGATPVRLAVVSQLAEGADRLVVEQVFAEAETRDEEARLEVILPMPAGQYAREQDFSLASRAELDAWLARATSTTELEVPDSWGADELSHAYQVAGQRVISRCDILVALWDGGPGDRGGTAETLSRAATLGKPCIWIPTEGGLPVRDNFDDPVRFCREVEQRAGPVAEEAPELPADPLAQLQAAYVGLAEFNRARLSRERADGGTHPAAESFAWIDPSFRRASMLAERQRWIFNWSARLISTLATVAAVLLGVSVGFDTSSWAVWGELCCLVLLGLGLVLVHRLRIHERWLSYRALAERLRSARYVARTGLNFRDAAMLRGVYDERRSAEWLVRAFEEVWDGRPKPSAAAVSSDELRRLLVEDWIGGQIDFHERAARHHKRWNRIMTRTIFALFVLTIAFAIVHALGHLHPYAAVLSISLPAAGASVGALLTVSQHRGLGERYGRMHAELKAIQRAMPEDDQDGIAQASSEAARRIAEEWGDWLGAMWFLDIEHAP
jgi:SMODS and SLOG-associating 2TM effector domain 1